MAVRYVQLCVNIIVSYYVKLGVYRTCCRLCTNALTYECSIHSKTLNCTNENHTHKLTHYNTDEPLVYTCDSSTVVPRTCISPSLYFAVSPESGMNAGRVCHRY